jgi:hypothetical protein
VKFVCAFAGKGHAKVSNVCAICSLFIFKTFSLVSKVVETVGIGSF